MSQHEFLPWNTWVNQPQNRGLTSDQALSKFTVERNDHLKKMIYYENQQKMRDIQNGK
jgi:hypothetical protein